MWFYDELSNQPSDRIATYLDTINQGKPIVFVNNLPVEIIIIQESSFYGTSKIIGTVSALSNFNVEDLLIEDGDIFYFMNTNYLNNLIHVCPSYKMVKRHGKVIIGSVSTFTGTFRRDISPGGDVTSINLHNLLMWPISVEKDSKTIAYIQENVDLGTLNHHGDLTTSPSVYYDNLNQGIKIGEHFDVYVYIKGKKIFLISFILHDNDVHNIFIGNVTSQFDKKNLTGINSDVSDRFGNFSGRAIYRLGNELDRVKEKNGVGIDKQRNTMNKRNVRSTVPLARYYKISGENVGKIM